MLNAIVNGYTGEVKLEVVTPILPDFELVRIDETEHYNAERLKYYGIKKVYGVYLYDKNCVTCCCFFQKDHYLCYAGYTYETISELNDGETEATEEFLIDANRETEDGFYMAVSAVERIAEEDRHEINIFSDEEKLEASEDRKAYDDLFKATIEHYQGNQIW
jgi:hypothetical protein